jgi:hypothetical protein
MSDEIEGFLRRMADEVQTRPGIPAGMLGRAARRRARTVTVGTLVLALVGYGGFAGVRALTRPAPVAPATAQACSWDRVASPNMESDSLSNRLLAVDALSERDVWAVGDAYVPEEGGDQRAIAMHWDGTAWTLTDLPPVGTGSSLTDVAAVAPGDVWAVGFDGNRSLIIHWDGNAWSEVPGPATEGQSQLDGIAAVAANDVWVVGASSEAPMAIHWNGEAWHRVPTPNPDPQPLVDSPVGFLRAVVALDSQDVWAVGETANLAPAGPSDTLVMHWDGGAWTTVPSPDPPLQDPPHSFVFDVAGAAGDLWAVGSWATEPGYGGAADSALLLHWDGSAWMVSPLPPLPDHSRLAGIAAQGQDAWAVGSSDIPGSYQPLILRRDSGGWIEVETAQLPDGWLAEVALTPSGQAWAVGTTEEMRGRTLVLHCGTS